MHTRVNDTGIGRIAVISAMPGGNAAKILEAIASPGHEMANRREFEWEDGIDGYCGRVCSQNSQVAYPLSLMFGRAAGLFLEDTKRCRTWSCKARRESSGVFVMQIGDGLPESRLTSIANNIIGCWVIRGFDWKDRRGATIAMPYGKDPLPKNSRQRHRRSRRTRRPSRLHRWR